MHRLLGTTFRGITCIINRLILYLVLLHIICCGFKLMIDRINKIHENYAHTNSNDSTVSANVGLHVFNRASLRVRCRIIRTPQTRNPFEINIFAICSHEMKTCECRSTYDGYIFIVLCQHFFLDVTKSQS